jgi:hypothetical protein
MIPYHLFYDSMGFGIVPTCAFLLLFDYEKYIEIPLDVPQNVTIAFPQHGWVYSLSRSYIHIPFGSLLWWVYSKFAAPRIYHANRTISHHIIYHPLFMLVPKNTLYSYYHILNIPLYIINFSCWFETTHCTPMTKHPIVLPMFNRYPLVI